MEERYDVSILSCRPDWKDERVEEAVRKSIELVGGIDSFVKKGDRVLIKPNLVADPLADSPRGKRLDHFIKGVNSHCTDVRTIAPLVKLCREAGASRVVIAEAYDPSVFEHLGYMTLSKEMEVPLIYANEGPYIEVHIPDGYVFKSFYVNKALIQFDKLINAAKLKVHVGTGISGGMKNLMGLFPLAYYSHTGRGARSRFHSLDPELGNILPYLSVDFNLAFHSDLTFIEGMVASDIHEHFAGTPVEMDVLIAGGNVVATDTVEAAVLGFDPTVDYPVHPFVTGRNYLKLAVEKGLGINDLGRINIKGESAKSVQKHKFTVRPEVLYVPRISS